MAEILLRTLIALGSMTIGSYIGVKVIERYQHLIPKKIKWIMSPIPTETYQTLELMGEAQKNGRQQE